MFNKRELATVLAALRHWQRQIEHAGREAATAHTHFEHVEPLGIDDIDALCQRLNAAPLRDDVASMCHALAVWAAKWAACSDWREAPAVFKDLALRCRRLLERLDAWDPQPCDCEQPGYFFSGVPGVLARVENGRLAPDAKVERCDLCCRYPSDRAAMDQLRELGIA